jgi:hypothetical protein
MGEERPYEEEGRYYPGYLTPGEYEQQRRRLDEMVKGFLRGDPIEKVGETANFCIEVDRRQKTVLLKERNIVVQCPFKLSIKQDEVNDIVKLLTKGVALLG